MTVQNGIHFQICDQITEPSASQREVSSQLAETWLQNGFSLGMSAGSKIDMRVVRVQDAGLAPDRHRDRQRQREEAGDVGHDHAQQGRAEHQEHDDRQRAVA